MSIRRGPYFWRWVEEEGETRRVVNTDIPPDNGYQRRNWVQWQAMGRPDNRGMKITLSDGTVFWSRGESGDCPHCHTPLRQMPHLARFDAVRNGVRYSGWGCHGVPSYEPLEEWR